MEITYKLEPINLEVDKPEDAVPPALNERIIEKHGEVIKLTLKEIEDNLAGNAKRRKETEAKLKYETAKKENIEHFHPFVKEFTPEQLATLYMYKEALGYIDLCGKSLEALDKQDKIDNDEIAEIKKQIPLLDVKEPVESPYVEIVEVSDEEESEDEE